jgi:urease accessory protein
MEKHTIATKSLSRFMQIFDASFPSGVFVHSFGLEPHIVKEKVTNIDELKVYLENLLKYQYQKLEFVFVKNIYKQCESNNINALIKEDKNFFAMQNYEFSKASKTIGANYLKQINFSIQKEIVKNYFQACKDGKAIGNELAVLSTYAYELDIDKETLLLIWCKKNLINIATSSLKISRIKPSDIQKILFEFDEILEDMIGNSEQHLSNFNPLFEEIIYQHKYLEPKLFMT